MPTTNARGAIISDPPNGLIAEGAVVTLTGPEGSNYQWRKNGATLQDTPPGISGTTSRMLVISWVDGSDQGVYQCLYDDVSKSTAITSSFALFELLQAGGGVPALSLLRRFDVAAVAGGMAANRE